MTVGLSRQAGGSQISDGARPASVVLHLDLPDQMVTLKGEFRVVPHDELVRKLSDMRGGSQQIQLVGSIPQAKPDPNKRYSTKRSFDDE